MSVYLSTKMLETEATTYLQWPFKSVLTLVNILTNYFVSGIFSESFFTYMNIPLDLLSHNILWILQEFTGIDVAFDLKNVVIITL